MEKDVEQSQPQFDIENFSATLQNTVDTLDLWLVESDLRENRKKEIKETCLLTPSQEETLLAMVLHIIDRTGFITAIEIRVEASCIAEKMLGIVGTLASQISTMRLLERLKLIKGKKRE
ncbi:MAG: hypothetical protein EZS28_011085 [Streblomastix strix]|uniref:Uncharacterized protein n=1 Tax=Streblomastix strix TaxID=222440 RepID=A0A5J4WEK3_9EUKA|nr:MAG: hypothetical protein EZS28_011085 [Streblomastix strix]